MISNDGPGTSLIQIGHYYLLKLFAFNMMHDGKYKNLTICKVGTYLFGIYSGLMQGVSFMS